MNEEPIVVPSFWRRLSYALVRATALTVLGAVLVSVDDKVARALNVPAFAPILLMSGWMFIAVAATHLARVILFPSVDLMATARYAVKHPVGAGLVFVGMCIVLAALLMSQARAQTMAERAAQYLPILVAEQKAHWPDAPQAYTMAGQVRAESAWRPTAELKTSREHGVGFGQLTKVWRADGTVVFDRFADARKLHPSLRSWSWDDRFNPEKQFRALVLMNLAEWRAIVGAAGDTDRWAMALAAYNGGRAGLLRDRALCAGTAGCDPAFWFEHVEKYSWRAKTSTPEYGRSFFEINRAYARNIVTDWRYDYWEAFA